VERERRKEERVVSEKMEKNSGKDKESEKRER
jgi:hypothetical protein